jgi:hypothetical protein
MTRFAIRYGVLPRLVDVTTLLDGGLSEAAGWLPADGERFGYLAVTGGPLAETLTCRAGTVTVRERNTVRIEADLVAVLDGRLAERRIEPTTLPFDFVGGYLGDLAGPADSVWTFVDRLIAFDHQDQRSYLLAVEDGRSGVRAAADYWIADTLRRLRWLPAGAADGSPEPRRVRRYRAQLAVGESCGRLLLETQPGEGEGYLGLAGVLELTVPEPIELPAPRPAVALSAVG